MKILFLAHRIPYPADKGDKIRAFAELRALAERGHEVHLFAFADDPDDLQYQVDLSRYCAEVSVLRLRRAVGAIRAGLHLVSGRPLSVGYYSSIAMKRMIDRYAREIGFDAAVVYSSTMFQYVPEGLAIRTIIDMVDADSGKWEEYSSRYPGFRSIIYGIEGSRLGRYEREIVRRAAFTVLSSEREARVLGDLDEFTRRARLRIMTNGVDTDYFHPGSAVPQVRPVLVFTGTMDYRPNIDGVVRFVEEVWPSIRSREPEAEFAIVGRNPASEVRRLAMHPGVIVTGQVDDVRPWLHRATAVVAPLDFAFGVQNKVLEAMACGKPVIASPAAVAGLSVEDGRHLRVAATDREFADAVVDLLNDGAGRRSLSLAAREFVEREHQWSRVLATFIRLVESFGAAASDGRSAVSIHS